MSAADDRAAAAAIAACSAPDASARRRAPPRTATQSPHREPSQPCALRTVIGRRRAQRAARCERCSCSQSRSRQRVRPVTSPRACACKRPRPRPGDWSGVSQQVCSGTLLSTRSRSQLPRRTPRQSDDSSPLPAPRAAERRWVNHRDSCTVGTERFDDALSRYRRRIAPRSCTVRRWQVMGHSACCVEGPCTRRRWVSQRARDRSPATA